MKVSKFNVLCHELIGLKAKILSHPDPSLKGVEGVIMWESPRTIQMDLGSRRITILKPGSILLLQMPEGEWVKVKGDELLGGPFERAKRMIKGEKCSAGF